MCVQRHEIGLLNSEQSFSFCGKREDKNDSQTDRKIEVNGKEKDTEKRFLINKKNKNQP